MPWVMMVDSSATTGRPAASASRTAGAIVRGRARDGMALSSGLFLRGAAAGAMGRPTPLVGPAPRAAGMSHCS